MTILLEETIRWREIFRHHHTYKLSMNMSRGVIRSRNSKGRQFNGKKKRDKKGQNNDLQNTTQKTKNRTT